MITIDTLFLLVVPTYLVLVAYGQVGARRRGLGRRARWIAAALRVALPPVALLAALLWTENPRLIEAWGLVAVAMGVAGLIVAALVELIAPRVGA